MPFWPTLYHMGARLAEKTPAGLLADQPKAERIYDTVMGGLMFSGLTALAIGGEITGSGPDDPQKKQEMRDLGWRPNSTRIGPYFVPNRLLGSFGPMFNSAGEVGDALRYGKGETDPYAISISTVKRLGNVVSDQVYFKGLGDILNAMKDPERFLQGYATSTVGRVIPYGATLRTLATATDNVERRPERAKDIGLPAAIGQGLEAGIPGLRQQVPPVQDVLGNPVQNNRTGPAALLPAYGQQKSAPLLKAFIDAGVDIGPPPGQITVKGKSVSLTPAEQRTYRQIMGRELQLNAFDALAEPAPVAKAAKLQRALDRARATAAAEISQGGAGLRADLAGVR